jgi:hypothetical protein
MLAGLAALDGFALKDTARVGGERVRNVDDHLTFAMWAKALLASVLVFNFKDVPVRTFNANTHVRPASRTTEVAEKEREKQNHEPESGLQLVFRLLAIICLSL